VQVAAAIMKEAPGAKVYNLCGGLIAWFNAGEAMEDEGGGEVEALHPFSDALKPFITRANACTDVVA
jgi:hypothetical protein